MKKWLCFALTGWLIAFAAGCGGEAQTGGQAAPKTGAVSRGGGSAAPKDLTFGAATVGGFWYVLAGALGEEIQKKIPGTSVTVIEGGSISNIQALEQNKFQIGFSNGQTIPDALEGKPPFEKKIENIRSVAALYPNVFYIVVPAKSDIKRIEDLKGKKVSPGVKGYSGELLFQDILKIHGLSYDDLAGVEYVGTSDGANLLQDGHIDALVGMLSAPNSTIQELDTSIGIRIIPIPEETVAKLTAMNSGYEKYILKGGTYKSEPNDLLTVDGQSVLLVNKDMPEDLVYQITKLTVENAAKWKALSSSMKDFDGKYAIEHIIGPLHPGAEKYYREVGLLK